MEEDQLKSLLEQYGTSLTDEEALQKLRPEVVDQLRAHAAKQLWARRKPRLVRRTMLCLVPFAAAACIIWLVWPRAALLDQVVVAGDAKELFVRAAPAVPVQDEFWVGVEVTAPCWVYLVERTEAGELIAARPQASSDDYSVHVSDRAGLGPFRVVEANAPAGPSEVTHVIVIAVPDPIPIEALAENIPNHIALQGDEKEISTALDDLAKSLEEAHGWSARYQRVRTDSD